MQTVIVIIIVGLCAVYIGRRFYKNIKGGPASCSCANGCGDCATQPTDCDLTEYIEPKRTED